MHINRPGPRPFLSTGPGYPLCQNRGWSRRFVILKLNHFWKNHLKKQIFFQHCKCKCNHSYNIFSSLPFYSFITTFTKYSFLHKKKKPFLRYFDYKLLIPCTTDRYRTRYFTLFRKFMQLLSMQIPNFPAILL